MVRTSRSTQPPDLDPSTSSSLKILVIDDGASTADMLSLFFKLEGHQVDTAYSGQAGLDAASREQPDLVFLDLSMPDMDGHETARRLRQRPGGDRLILVALTGWDRDTDHQTSLASGFDHYLVKPVEPSTLRELLARIAEERRSNASTDQGTAKPRDFNG
jgi:CheY-like chemotaxis protein